MNNYDDDDRDIDRVTRREVRRERYTTDRDYVERERSTGSIVAIVLIVVLALLAIVYWGFRDNPQSFAVPGQSVPSTVIVQPAPAPDTVVVPAPAPAPVLTPTPAPPDASYEAQRAADEARDAARAAKQRAREAKDARDAANAAKDSTNATPPVDAPIIPRDRTHNDGRNIDSQDNLPATPTDRDSSTSTNTN